MEKIYTQEQKEQKERKQKKGLQRNVDFSVALSVIVAAFALFSVASFNIMNRQEEKVSYAAPTGDTFKMVAPEGVQMSMPEKSQTELIISGYDKQAVSEFAANIREIRKPEPYKGKGIKYKDEHIRRKEGKKAA